jgi:hypothetical protein
MCQLACRSSAVWYMSVESHGGMILAGETKELWGKPVPMPLHPPQIPHGLIYARTLAFATNRPSYGPEPYVEFVVDKVEWRSSVFPGQYHSILMSSSGWRLGPLFAAFQRDSLRHEQRQQKQQQKRETLWQIPQRSGVMATWRDCSQVTAPEKLCRRRMTFRNLISWLLLIAVSPLRDPETFPPTSQRSSYWPPQRPFPKDLAFHGEWDVFKTALKKRFATVLIFFCVFANFQRPHIARVLEQELCRILLSSELTFPSYLAVYCLWDYKYWFRVK